MGINAIRIGGRGYSKFKLLQDILDISGETILSAARGEIGERQILCYRPQSPALHHVVRSFLSMLTSSTSAGLLTLGERPRALFRIGVNTISRHDHGGPRGAGESALRTADTPDFHTS